MTTIIKNEAFAQENIKEVRELLLKRMNLFIRQVDGKLNIHELTDYMSELINSQDKDGYWRLIDREDIPFDAKIEYWKYPTVLFLSSLIHFQVYFPTECTKLSGFAKTLYRALDIIEQGKLIGHGYEAFEFKIKALNLLLEAGVIKFISLYPKMHPAFSGMLMEIKKFLQESLIKNKTKFDYDEEFNLRIEKVMDGMDGKDNVFLFVYGTLMSNSRHGHSYLDTATYKGECTLNGYALHDLEYYPGIIADVDGRVLGELYSVSRKLIPSIDIYEAEGSLYKREMVQVFTENGENIEAYAYVYNRLINNGLKIPFQYLPWYEGIRKELENFVWYACYGSNINTDRFMKYINGDEAHIGCTDKTPPKEEKPFNFKYSIYFANHSGKWDGKGVAFLDTNKKGKSYGKMYLITKEQFEEIHSQEGSGDSWYNKEVCLGDEDGIPIKTFTNSIKLSEVIPSQKYIGTIKNGLSNIYPKLKDAEIDIYLLKKILNNDMVKILQYLRSQPHGVSIKEVSNALALKLEAVIQIFSDLRNLNLIKQDSRSIRNGHYENAGEAIYYTVREMREIIGLIV